MLFSVKNFVKTNIFDSAATEMMAIVEETASYPPQPETGCLASDVASWFNLQDLVDVVCTDTVPFIVAVKAAGSVTESMDSSAASSLLAAAGDMVATKVSSCCILS